MHLSPKEIEKLALHGAGFLAQKRLWRGLRLNYPETVALIASQLLEFIRDGEEGVAELMDKGKRLLGFEDVLPGVAEMVHEVQVEGTFPDGVKLVTVHRPICAETGSLELALYGTGLAPETAAPRRGGSSYNELEAGGAVPGELVTAEGTVELNAGRATVALEVTNTGDRPVQVGSHYPFFEVNSALRFDRARAFGFRLDIPSGTAVRFEPGETRRVELVALAGERLVFGGNGLTGGRAGEEERRAALERALSRGFSHVEEKA